MCRHSVASGGWGLCTFHVTYVHFTCQVYISQSMHLFHMSCVHLYSLHVFHMPGVHIALIVSDSDTQVLVLSNLIGHLHDVDEEYVKALFTVPSQ